MECVCLLSITYQVQYCTWWGIADLALLKIHFSFMVYCNLFKIMWIERQMFFLIEKHKYKPILKNNSHQVSFIRIKALMHLIRYTFHYVDMTRGITFLSSELLSMRLCESAKCVRRPQINGFFLTNTPL
jgi:hypothetical protein